MKKTEEEIEELVGGAILDNVEIQEPARSGFTPPERKELPVANILQSTQLLWMAPNVGTDISFRRDIGGDAYEPEAWGMDPAIIKRAIVRNTTGHGVRHDDAHTANSIIQSLADHQPILDLYLSGRA